MSVIDGDRVHLIDWRAAAATPFYRATPLEPLGVSHRRHLHYIDGRLTDYSDEVFDTDALLTATQLRGEAALLAALATRTDGRMKAVVATIQAEQDAGHQVLRRASHQIDQQRVAEVDVLRLVEVVADPRRR